MLFYFLNHHFQKIMKGLTNFSLIAIEIPVVCGFEASKCRIGDEVFNFLKVGKDSNKFAHTVGVVESTCKDIIFVNTLADWLDEYIICCR